MRKALFLLMILSQAFAASVQLRPDYVRMPVGSNHTFDVEMEGDGKVYQLQLFGPYLSWQSQKVWVGPSGKTLQVTFSPPREGDYTVKADFAGQRSEASVRVYARETTDIPGRISSIRSHTNNPAVLELVTEAEALYNQSRLQLADIKLQEAESLLAGEQPAEPSKLPQFLLAAVVTVVALLSARMLLG